MSETDRELARGRDPQVHRLVAQGWEGGCWVPPTWEASPLHPAPPHDWLALTKSLHLSRAHPSHLQNRGGGAADSARISGLKWQGPGAALEPRDRSCHHYK